MVSVYIRYHLKNGRTVNRAYYLPESKEILALASDIYDNWDYKKQCCLLAMYQNRI